MKIEIHVKSKPMGAILFEIRFKFLILKRKFNIDSIAIIDIIDF